LNKIALIGSGGSGKSTLARKLGKELKIEVFHLDTLFWKPNWTGVPKGEQRKVQNELVENEEWIFDGNYGGTIDIRLNAADTIIFLDISRVICIFRLIKRRIKYHNKTRPDVGEGCNERISLEWLKWVWDYPKTKRPNIYKKLEPLSKEKKIIILKTPKEVENFLNKVKNG
jgi:adenylate kinase family enzyme